MEKVKYIPLGLFCSYFIKSLIMPASIENALILLILGGIAAFYQYKQADEKIKWLEQHLQLLGQEKTKDIEHLNLQISEIKTHIGGLKLSQTLRSPMKMG